MQLSLRLSAIAGMVTEGNRLVDVGCDHGYLPVFLVLNHKIPSAIAMDVRPGPLSRAREHIRQYDMEKQIETRLSDGLQAFKEGEGDTLVIAGMGGPLMERILSDGKEVRNCFREMILQPQSHIPHFRQYIMEEGYEIIAEDLIYEDGKFYPLMKVIPAKEPVTSWTPLELRFGKLLLEQRHPVLPAFLEREERICRDILKNLSRTESVSGEGRGAEVQEDLEMIAKAMRLWRP